MSTPMRCRLIRGLWRWHRRLACVSWCGTGVSPVSCPAPGPPRSGFTLAELVLSMAIMSILMTGLASAILVASHALPDSQSPASAIVESADAADQIVEELRSAIWIRERTATSVEFTIPDRDSDGIPERIRYAWSGTPGEALTRQYNGGSVVDLLEDVCEFDLAYDLKTVTEEYPGAVVESGEVLFSSYSAADELRDFSIDDDHWIGQYFKPSLPGEAVSWRITRVLFEAEYRGGTSGQTLVQLRPADVNKLPTDTVLEENTMYESDLSDVYTWREFSFSNVSGLAPGGALCLVLQWVCDDHSANIQYDDEDGSGLLKTSDAGGSWSFDNIRPMRHYVYGTYSTPGSPQTATRQYVTGVHIALQAGDDPAARVVTTAQTLNTPELLSGLWEADFNYDPTLDLNGDGISDWLVHGGGVFNTGSLDNGVWHGYAQLDTRPYNNFTGLTTAEVRFWNTTVVGTAAVFGINADWSGSTYAPIVALLELQPDGTQTLTVYHKLDFATKARLATVIGLPDDFVTLRLLIDPDLGTVNVKVNGQDHGTYVYNKIVPAIDQRFATIRALGGGADFDYVSVRVNE